MKIVIIEPDGRGGLFHYALQLCSALGRLGHDVTLVTATDAEFSDTSGLFVLNPCLRLWNRTVVADHALPHGMLGKMLRMTRRSAHALRRVYRAVKLTLAWFRVRLHIESASPDVVIVSTILYPHILWIATRMARPERVMAQICHEIGERDVEATPKPRAWRDVLQDYLVARFDRIFFLSEATRQDFLQTRHFPPERTTRIPHGRSEIFRGGSLSVAEMRRRLGFGPSETVILFFGILRPSKGLDELVDAFAQARARNSARLLIAGCATKFMDMTAFYARIARLGLTDAVRVENRYIDPEEVAPLFELARAVVLPYRNAAASGVLHMAYAFARAPIVTAVGGLAEDVIAGETGLVAAPGDVAGLARLIDCVVDDAELASELGRAGNAFSQRNFSWTSVAERIADTLAADVRSRAPHASGAADASPSQK